jgi:hypothetical protein
MRWRQAGVIAVICQALLYGLIMRFAAERDASGIYVAVAACAVLTAVFAYATRRAA